MISPFLLRNLHKNKGYYFKFTFLNLILGIYCDSFITHLKMQIF